MADVASSAKAVLFMDIPPILERSCKRYYRRNSSPVREFLPTGAKYIFSVTDKQHLRTRLRAQTKSPVESSLTGGQTTTDHLSPTGLPSVPGMRLRHSSSLPFAVRSIRSTLERPRPPHASGPCAC